MFKLQVSGITCGGCAAAIERSLGAALPGAKVEVNVMTGVVEVSAQPAQREAVKTAIEDAGFTVTGEAA
jgi:copper chaperone